MTHDPVETQVLRAYFTLLAIGVLMLAFEFAAAPERKLSCRPRWRAHRVSGNKGLFWRFLLHALLGAFVATAAFLTLLQTRHPESITLAVVRLAAGVALLYGAADFIFAACSLGYLAAGYSLPLMHRNPIEETERGRFNPPMVSP